MTENRSQGTSRCLSCGAQLLPGARFCLVCGRPQIQPPAAQIPPQATHQPVYISYSGEDRSVAEKVCRLLELEGIHCWIAPRNVNPRRDYGEQIIAAIEAAPAMVLILSANANTSIFVANEVERAVSNRKAVFVLRIEEVRPSPALELFVSRSQWIDAWKPPLEDFVHILATAIRSLLSLPAIAVTMPRPASGLLSRRRLVGSGGVGVGLAALATVALVGGLLFFMSRSPGPTASALPATTAAQNTSGSASPIVTSSSQPTAREPGSYFTGSMAVARASHTATLLSDGRVLIAGGTDGAVDFASAELYDPKAGTFSTTKSMVHARSGHIATLLSNGRVLIAGGFGASGALASAELYDPKTGTFSSTGSMAVARQWPTATLLPGGRVLIAGGWSGSVALASSELYDPASGTFIATGSLAQGRSWHTATLLLNGHVLIAGGNSGDSGASLASAELYDPASGKFSPTGSMTHARYGHTDSLLSDGRVVIVAGTADQSGSSLDSVERYDPSTGQFTVIESAVTQARCWHTATLLPDWSFLIVGGYDGGGNSDVGALPSGELYDPGTGLISASPSMAVARYSHTATLLPDGRVLIAGGYGKAGILASAELYQP